MELKISGHHIDLGDGLRTHVTDRLEAGISKYFDRPVDAQVTFSRDGAGFKCEAAVHLSSGIHLQSHAQGIEIYSVFDAAAERLEKRLRRYKRRLKDHSQRAKEPVPQIEATAFVIRSDAESQDETEEPDDLTPVVIAEMTTEIKTLSVGEAVMQLDLLETPALLFHNGAHGGLNMVYRRPDGHIGWIDPQGVPANKASGEN